MTAEDLERLAAMFDVQQDLVRHAMRAHPCGWVTGASVLDFLAAWARDFRGRAAMLRAAAPPAPALIAEQRNTSALTDIAEHAYCVCGEYAPCGRCMARAALGLP